MIRLDKTFEPSAHVIERARLMWATKYDQGEHTVIYRVTPFGKRFDHETADRRLVVFDAKRRAAECLSLETGEHCIANIHGRLCAHVYAASKRLHSSAKRAA